jgi:hypothetical protein
MKRVYLAGGMTGIEHFNFPAFDRAARRLRDEGHDVFSPADNDRRLLGRPLDWMPQESDSAGPWKAWAIDGAPGIRKMLGDDVAYICNEADAIAMLPGWENSKGARAEWHLSLALGHEVIYL